MNAVKNYFADTPKWVKYVRFAGVLIGAAGGAIITGGAIVPPLLVTAAPWMVLGGNFAALFVQSYSKKQ